MKILKEGISAQEIYEKYDGPKKIRNGVYCMIINGTYQAINSIPPIVEYEEGDLLDDD